VQVVLVVQDLYLFLILALNVVLAELLRLLEATPSTLLHLLALTLHKEKICHQ
jgi:hypothetical protein